MPALLSTGSGDLQGEPSRVKERRQTAEPLAVRERKGAGYRAQGQGVQGERPGNLWSEKTNPKGDQFSQFKPQALGDDLRGWVVPEKGRRWLEKNGSKGRLLPGQEQSWDEL